MQSQRRSGSYSNLRTQLERDIEEERQALLEDQKICRIRAHKFSSETNRRRRALEDKRRDEEEKEQRFREEVLQQRKQKLQEATEKFQRAHLPPSQRRRPVYTVHRKPAPRLEDALEQIQGSVLSATSYISSANKYSSTRLAEAPSSTVSENGHWFQTHVQSKTDYDQMAQERIRGNYRPNPIYYKQHLAECQQHPLENQHPNNAEDAVQQTTHLADSESLSSVDSLENGDEKECSTEHTAAPSLATQEDSLSHETLRPQSVTSAHLHAAGEDVTKDQAVRNWLLTLNNQNNVSIASDKTFNENICNSNGDHIKNLSKIENKTPEKSKTNMYASHITSNTENTHSVFTDNNEDSKVVPKSNTWVSQSPAYEMVNRNKMLASGGTGHKPTKAWVSPDPTPRETVQAYAQGNISEQNHPSRPALLRVDQYMSTSNTPLSSEQNQMDGPYYCTTSTNSVQESQHFKDITTNAFIHKLDDFLIEKSNVDYISVTTEQTASDINNNKALAVSQVTPNSSTLSSNYIKKDEQADESMPTAPLFHASFREQNKPRHFTEQEETGFLKGILKKDSKYENGYSSTLLYNRGISFGNHACIRDSVELRKGKGKDSQNLKTNKRLRWFDEIRQANIEDEDHGSRNQNHVTRVLDYMTTRSVASRGHSAPSNNQEHLKRPMNMTNAIGAELVSVPVVSTGYHFAKQAWMSPKNENGTTQGNHDNQRPNLPKGKTKVIRRPRSAKSTSDSGYKNRKGAMIRPQSAIEANKVMKTQGKVIIPHPPPKLVLNNRISQNVTVTAYPPLKADNFGQGDTMQPDLNSHKNKPETNPALHSVMYNNNSVIVMPSPPSHGTPGYETTSKTTVTVNTIQTVAQKETSPALAKQSPLYGENGLRLDRTPTDEEISLLWHGVRNALAQADPNTGELRNYDPHYNNPFALSSRPNISHVTIDGGSLLTNSKSLLKMNGFFSPTSNGTIALTRRKQILDTNEIKRQALLEQRRHTASSSGWRPHPSAQNAVHTVQMKPFPFDPLKAVNGVPDAEGVSESTSQFLLAEKLVDTTAAEGEMLTVMENLKPSRQTMLMSKAQRVGVSALSFEEQKLLQSLDRLNQRLQFVQQTIIRNPSTAGVVQISSPLNIHQYGAPQPTETTLTMQRYRSMSADNRTRWQRKF